MYTHMHTHTRTPVQVAAFASMWISNVAAPVLCFSLFQPILRTMDVSTPFAKSLVRPCALCALSLLRATSLSGPTCCAHLSVGLANSVGQNPWYHNIPYFLRIIRISPYTVYFQDWQVSRIK